VDGNGDNHEFNVVVDVLPGPHPFLLGMPTLKMMNAQIIFGKSNDIVSMTLGGKKVQVPLKTDGSHPHLMFAGTIKAQRADICGSISGFHYTIRDDASFYQD
jgi:hypothetical protein